MAPKLTLAEKYAEHKKRTERSLLPARSRSFLNKNSTPLRPRLRTLDSNRPYAAKTSIGQVFETNDKVKNTTAVNMPGNFMPPIKLHQPVKGRSPIGRYRLKYEDYEKLSNDSFRVKKNSQFASPRRPFSGNGMLHGLWLLASKIGLKNQTRSDASEFRRSTHAAANTAPSSVDVESLLSMKKYSNTATLDEDPVEEMISVAKDRQKTKAINEERQALIDALYKEMKKSDDLKSFLEKQSLQMRHEFRSELQQATEGIRELTRKAELKNKKITEQDIEQIENRLLKENEKFLTHKYEAEAKLDSMQISLQKREKELTRKEKEYEKKQLQINLLVSKVNNLLSLSLEMIKSEYDNECSITSTELESVETAKKINCSHGKHLLQSLETHGQDQEVKALFILKKLLYCRALTESEYYDLPDDKDAAFVAETQDKVQRCQEYVADFDLEYIRDSNHIGDLYNLESLGNIEECFERAKKTIHGKLSRTKSKERRLFKTLTSPMVSLGGQLEMEIKVSAFLANYQLQLYRTQLVGLLKSINELLRSLKILKVKFESKN